MSNKRIDTLTERLEAVQDNPERLRAVLKKAKVSDLLVLHFLNMGYSGTVISSITEAISEELMDHFAQSNQYLSRAAGK